MNGTNPDAGLDRTGGAGDVRGGPVDDRDGRDRVDPTAADSGPNGVTFSLAHSHGDYIRHLHAFLVTLDKSVTIATLDPHPYYGGDHAPPREPADAPDHSRDAEADGYAASLADAHGDTSADADAVPGEVLRPQVTEAVRSSDV